MSHDNDRAPMHWFPILVALAVIGVGPTGCTFDETVGQNGSGSETGDTGTDEAWTVDGATDDGDGTTSDATGDTDRPDPRDSGADTRQPDPDTGGCKGGACDDTGADTSVAMDTGADTTDTSQPIDTGQDTSGGRDTGRGDTMDAADGCTGSNCGTDTTDTGPTLQGVDLSGRWIAKGYGCNGDEPIEVIDIRHSPSELVATKKVGDDCVETGDTTFETQNPPTVQTGDSLSIEMMNDSGSQSESLEIRTTDRLEIEINFIQTIEFVRADTSNLDGVSIAGTWETLGYKCSWDPRGEMKIQEKSNEHVATTHRGDHCIDEWRGKRQGKASFSVDITGTDRRGNTITVQGTADILAHEFILVSTSAADWQIRMWEKSLF